MLGGLEARTPRHAAAHSGPPGRVGAAGARQGARAPAPAAGRGAGATRGAARRCGVLGAGRQQRAAAAFAHGALPGPGHHPHHCQQPDWLHHRDLPSESKTKNKCVDKK